MYYFKFSWKLNNDIEYFWYDNKSYTCKNCTYTIKRLKKRVFAILKNVNVNGQPSANY